MLTLVHARAPDPVSYRSRDDYPQSGDRADPGHESAVGPKQGASRPAACAGRLTVGYRRVRARRIWLGIHRWLGLAFGALLVLVGLTGSLIVFDHALDAWLNPDLFTRWAAGPPRPLAAVLTAARAAAPDSRSPVSVSMPAVDYAVFTVSFSGPPPHGRSVQVMVDPATARVLGRRDGDSHLMTLVYALHSSLLLDEPLGIPEGGAYAVGVAGLALMASLLSGLYLWWPRWDQLPHAVRVKRQGAKRVTFDLHRAVGFWSLAILLTVAFSGVSLVFRPWVAALVGVVAPVESPRPPVLSTPVAGAAPVSPDRALAIAAAQVPDGHPTWLDIPGDPTGVFRVWLRRSDDVRRVFGDTQIWIDQWSGAVLRVRDRRSLPAGERFLHWQFPLHSGEVFGLPGRLVVFGAGLLPTLLAVTGGLIWWRGRQARRRVHARQRRGGGHAG